MKRLFLVFLVILGLLGYVYVRSESIALYRRVIKLEKELDVLKERRDMEKVRLNEELLISRLEEKAKSLGMIYQWEADRK